ncbi:MAG: hypothetical protein ACE5JZ_08940 [Kiloniellales bacterium]
MSEADEARRDPQASPAGQEFCRIEITGPGVSVTRLIAMQRLPALLDHLLHEERDRPPAPAGKPSARPTRAPVAAPTGVSEAAGPAGGADDDSETPRGSRAELRRYYDDKRPSTNPERIAVLARFLEVAEGRRTFSKGDVRRRFLSTGVPLPRNFSRDYAAAVRRGYLVTLSDGHSYQVGSATRRLIDRDGPSLLPRSA